MEKVKNKKEMKKSKGIEGMTGFKIFNAAAFLFMVIINIFANLLPLNNVSTGKVSDSYPNLFAPAGFTFAVWILIYLLLAAFILYQIGLFHGDNEDGKNEIVKKISWYFIISSLANAAWIFAWHYRRIPLSVLFMLILWICLAQITGIMAEEEFSPKENIMLKLPFSIYFGWVTVAALANIVVLFVSLGWSGWGISQQTWTVIALLIGVMITALITLKNKDIAYGFTAIWAYAGILARHLSPSGFHGQYPVVIITAILCLAVLALTVLFVWAAKKKHPVKL